MQRGQVLTKGLARRLVSPRPKTGVRIPTASVGGRCATFPVRPPVVLSLIGFRPRNHFVPQRLQGTEFRLRKIQFREQRLVAGHDVRDEILFQFRCLPLT